MEHLCCRLPTHTTSRRFTSDCKLNVNSKLWLHSDNWFSNVPILFLLSFRHVRHAVNILRIRMQTDSVLLLLKNTVVIKGQTWLNTPMPNTCRLRQAHTPMQVILYMHTCSVRAKNNEWQDNRSGEFFQSFISWLEHDWRGISICSSELYADHSYTLDDLYHHIKINPCVKTRPHLQQWFLLVWLCSQMVHWVGRVRRGFTGIGGVVQSRVGGYLYPIIEGTKTF